MQRVLDWFVYVVVRLSETIVLSMPPEAAMCVADVAGTLWYLVDGRRRKRADQNLRVAFGDEMTARERRRVIRGVFRSMTRVPVEGIWIERLMPNKTRVDSRCRFFGDRDILVEHLEGDVPCFLFTGHIGNWEVAAQTVRAYPAPFQALARPIDNPHINRRLQTKRGGHESVVAKKGGLPGVLRALRKGYWIGIVGDQNAGHWGAFVPFFGLPASTSLAPAFIACRENVPFLMAACLRRPGRTMEFDIHVAHLDHPSGPDVSDDEMRDLVARSMQTLEAWVRLDPAQYNWLHRRWKSRPQDESADVGRPRYDHHRPPAQ